MVKNEYFLFYNLPFIGYIFHRHDELLALLALARGGIDTIFQAQKAALAE